MKNYRRVHKPTWIEAVCMESNPHVRIGKENYMMKRRRSPNAREKRTSRRRICGTSIRRASNNDPRSAESDFRRSRSQPPLGGGLSEADRQPRNNACWAAFVLVCVPKIGFG
jgi:hypothetical protein